MRTSKGMTVVAAVAAAAILLIGSTPPAIAADNYGDPNYAAYDADNMARTGQRQAFHLTDAEYGQGSFDTFTRTWLGGMERQVADAPHGRVYSSAGHFLPGGNVGDPQRYDLGDRTEVAFLSRTGAKLIGNVWPCPSGDNCPGVLITTGSIQVTQHMYGWAARALQAAGYTVMTFDVQGQGESESTSHAPGNRQPQLVNPQDLNNFVRSTLDALRFFHSTAAAPYAPKGWTPADVAAAQAEAGSDSGLSWSNPRAVTVDRTRLGLVGHSLGSSAVSILQQCSAVAAHWQTVAECEGSPLPVQAVVGWDVLQSTVRPTVPALDHQADGYFVNAVPSPNAPSADGHLAAHNAWKSAGVDVYSMTVRGGTHAEWSEIPYIVSGTRYGVPQAAYYLVAWMDRYVHTDPVIRTAATGALLDGPIPAETPGAHAPWRASLFSVKYRSAFAFTAPDGTPHAATDLRAYAGVAPLRDWAAANAEREGWACCAPL